MQLPMPWVERIFEKLTLIYGREFLARWDSCGVPLDEVKADWAKELGGFLNHPEALAYGLENVPRDRPPTVLQFREICRKAPVKAAPALTYQGTPMPEPVRQKLRELTERLRAKNTYAEQSK